MTKVLLLFNQGEKTTLTDVAMCLLDWVKYYSTHPTIKLDVVKERLWCDLKYNLAINAAIACGYDYIFQYDSDMIGDARTIQWLIERDKECVGTLFFNRNYPYEPQMWDVIEKDGEKYFKQFGRDTISNAVQEGQLMATSIRATGFTLFKMSAVKEIGYPFGESTPNQKIKHVINGWDSDFTKKISDRFGAVYTDCDLKYGTKHISYVGVDHKFYTKEFEAVLA